MAVRRHRENRQVRCFCQKNCFSRCKRNCRKAAVPSGYGNTAGCPVSFSGHRKRYKFFSFFITVCEYGVLSFRIEIPYTDLFCSGRHKAGLFSESYFVRLKCILQAEGLSGCYPYLFQSKHRTDLRILSKADCSETGNGVFHVFVQIGKCLGSCPSDCLYAVASLRHCFFVYAVHGKAAGCVQVKAALGACFQLHVFKHGICGQTDRGACKVQGITVSVQGQRVLRKDQCFSAAFHIPLQVNMGFRFTGAFLIDIGNCLFPCGKLRAFPIHFHEHCFLCHAHRQDVVSRHIPCRNIIPGYIARISRVITVVIGYVPCVPWVVTVVAGYIACIPRGVTVVAGHVTPGNLCRTDNLTALRKRGSKQAQP